jgi:hypothetical protein
MCFDLAWPSLEDVAFKLHKAVLCNETGTQFHWAWLLTPPVVSSPCGSSQPCEYELFPVPALCM